MTFHYSSDQSILLSLGDEISIDTHRRIVKLLRLLEADPIPEVRNLHPAYTSLLVKFDPCRMAHDEMERALLARMERLESIELPPPATVEVPVCYGGAFGPDLQDVAALHSLDASEVVRLHWEALYTVYFLGFCPGFSYLGGLPAAIATPRLDKPRKRVEAGSVGIAGQQTGVYPFATPGGWRLIGRTPLRIFRPDRPHMSLLSIGDQVRFRPISLEEYRSLRESEA